ncbi:hypothetical protein M2403_002486 [Rahnella sp. BIGb0603]|nr:hypothetical protein [Rahnella sp. BIGb0603]
MMCIKHIIWVSYACIMRMVLHDPERIKKHLLDPLPVLCDDLGHALKTVN